MREVGEPQITFNYTRAMADYVNNFTFGRGVSFRTPKETEAIVPHVLDRVWNTDNRKSKILWEMGQQGGVSGDCFVKVAYEEAWVDPAGRKHPGRVRILPINSSFAFPEWHPHDRTRLMRFKLKYRFWGTALEGTRQVFTYVELITESGIEEYVNDELISSRPNPLGVIPVVHIANRPVSGSPWGLADIQDITNLNREYNEKATDISDIINYHAAPVTVITGAKASQLEKSPKKVWGGLPKDANVFNLENGVDLNAPMEYLQMIKRGMHELTGIPETALGQMQPISNTSGVALAIQFQPLMNTYELKKTQYAEGLEKINEYVLLYIALYEPEMFQYDPLNDTPLKDGQFDVLDPQDPITYQTTTHWQPPLPVDQLIKLNEIQVKMALGLESKRGAMQDLGEEFPDEKLQELFDELVEDAKEQGALELLKSQIASMIAAMTGMSVDPKSGAAVPSAGGPGVTNAGQAGPAAATPAGATTGPLPGTGVDMANPEAADLYTQLVTLAHGTKLPQRRNPSENPNE